MAIVMLAITCVGCGNSDSNTGSSSTSGNSESEQKTEYKVGDVINFESEEITVTNVQRNYNTGNAYSKPAAGKEFVKLTVTIKNVSNSNISVNPVEFKMQDSNGAQELITGVSYTIDDGFDAADLIPGGTKTGSLVFEVPKDDANLKLVYTPNFISDKNILIKL